MLRGMNSFGDMEEDGESDSSSACRNVSVNYAADSGVSPERRVSQDTDTESFTYEHFPVVCPTCRGAGQVHEDDLKTLVSFVPVKDKRLQPSRIFCKMVIMLFVCLCIAGPVAFFLIPRSVGVRLQYEESSRISIPDNVTLTPYIIVNSYLFVRNDNYLPVKLTNINVKVSWNRIILNSGTCIRNISISVPSRKSIKRRLRSYGLGRGKNGVNEHSLKDLIRAELDGAGCLGGYRSVWHSLRLVNGVSVPRNTVAVLLKEIDPIGVENRRKRRLRRREYSSLGPNYAWHADGYDKLKDFGFPIHGCIDGYSRKLLWLELTRSNNNPAIIAGFYLDYVKEVGGCPVILSTDPGSENCVMSAIQVSLRSKCDDEYSGEKSHRFVESKRNQRIEAWWSYFRRNHSSWWINLFNDLVQKGLFLPGNEMHKECLWFCLSKFLRNNLNFVRVHWNTHYIRKSRFDTIPGKPDALYYLPENEGHTDQLIKMSTAEIQSFQEHCLRISDRDEDNEYHNYFKYVIEKDRLSLPDSWREGVQLYIQLITTARD